MSNTEFCCPAMTTAICNSDRQSSVIFTPKFREFAVRVLDGGISSVGIEFLSMVRPEITI